jgi:ribonuclease BN (tRNA processing enzyme)
LTTRGGACFDGRARANAGPASQPVAFVKAPVSIRITILGKSPAWQDAGGACSGYLLRYGGRTVVLDCGNGVFAKLRAQIPYEQVDELIITHLHADHMVDLVPFAYALFYGPKLREGRPVLHAPPGAREAWRSLCSAFGTETLLEDAFDLREYDPAAELAIEGARVRFQLVPHFIETYAAEVQLDGEAERFVFSADCGPNEELVEFARGADLLLIEAAREGVPGEAPDPSAGHLSGEQAGAIGRRAEVRRLVVTHYSDQLDAAKVRANVEAAYGGPVEMAVEGATYEV